VGGAGIEKSNTKSNIKSNIKSNTKSNINSNGSGRGRPLHTYNKQKRKRPRSFKNVAFIYAGNDLLSHTLSRAVQSAQRGLTSVFGMGTGGTPAVRSPTT
jgi:hypothetical protein